MTTKTYTIVVDDLDGGSDGVGTYHFAIEGVEYEIDLSEPNFDRLLAALAPFIAAGRRMARRHGTPARASDRQSTVRRGADPTTRQVRAWWEANADSSDLPAFRNRGVIPRQVQHAYGRAQRQPNQTEVGG